MFGKIIAFLVRLKLMLACVATAAGAILLGVQVPPIGYGMLAFIGWRQWRRWGWKGSGWSHGTARWAEIFDLARGGLLANRGPILGRVIGGKPTLREAVRTLFSRAPDAIACRTFLAGILGERWNSDRLIRVQSPVHILTAAPAGRGKGVSVVLPNLLSLMESMVVTDPKGENFLLSAEHRRKRFGHKVFRLDPFGVCGPNSNSYNPLLAIDPQAADFPDQCQDVASALIFRQGTEHDPTWNDNAELVLKAFIAFVTACEADPAKRTLSLVRGIVSSPERFRMAVAAMQKVEHPDVKRLGSQLEWLKDRELASVLANVNRHTQFLDSQAVAAVMNGSDFDPRMLRSGRCSLYLILPADRLTTHASLMRLWIGCTLRSLSRGGADESKKVFYLLDEAAHLGRLQILEDAVTLMRGYGIRLWFFFQSLAQLKACYGDKAEVMLDNFDSQQYFGTNAYDSAEAISKRIGEFTLTNTTYSENTGWSQPTETVGQQRQPGSRSGGSSVSTSDMARRLIKPEEILGLPDDTAIILHRNVPPVLARLLRYYDAPEFRKGRTGKQRGLSVAACVAAVCLLAGSLAFVGVAHSVATPGVQWAAWIGNQATDKPTSETTREELLNWQPEPLPQAERYSPRRRGWGRSY